MKVVELMTSSVHGVIFVMVNKCHYKHATNFVCSDAEGLIYLVPC